MLVAIKVVHTVVWALFVACILGIYVAARIGRIDVAFTLIAVVMGEVLILVLNGMRCPLTDVAARHTEERAANFDIYLPFFIARYNKEIFGTLYLGGIVYTLVEWLLRRFAA